MKKRKEKASLKYLKVIEKAQNGNPFESTEAGFLQLKHIFKSSPFSMLYLLAHDTQPLLYSSPAGQPMTL